VRSTANKDPGFPLSPLGLQWYNLAFEEDGQEVAARRGRVDMEVLEKESGREVVLEA
jgi:hypothetical protein